MKKDHLDPYRKAGVDPAKGAKLLEGILKSMPNTGPLPSNFFCQILPLPLSLEHPTYIALSTDGVGTKLLLGLQTGLMDGLGQDLVAMVYNDLITSGARPLAFLDYYATGKLDPELYPRILKSIQQACEKCEMPLLGGETAEMPGLYSQDHFDLAGFGVGMVEKERLLGPHKVTPGQVLIGFPSSGFHSNGYSLIRRVVENQKLKLLENHTFDGITKTLGEFLMEPTRLYTDVQKSLSSFPFSSLCHITGGGYGENLPRVLPPNCRVILQRDAFLKGRGELFLWFREEAALQWEEMVSIFNSGYGLVGILPKEALTATLEHFPEARKIGWVEERKEGEGVVVWG